MRGLFHGIEISLGNGGSTGTEIGEKLGSLGRKVRKDRAADYLGEGFAGAFGRTEAFIGVQLKGDCARGHTRKLHESVEWSTCRKGMGERDIEEEKDIKDRKAPGILRGCKTAVRPP